MPLSARFVSIGQRTSKIISGQLIARDERIVPQELGPLGELRIVGFQKGIVLCMLSIRKCHNDHVPAFFHGHGLVISVWISFGNRESAKIMLRVRVRILPQQVSHPGERGLTGERAREDFGSGVGGCYTFPLSWFS